LIPEGVAEASQVFFRDAHVLPKLLSYEEYCGRDRWKAHRHLVEVSGVSAVNSLVALDDIHGRKREVLFFYLTALPSEMDCNQTAIGLAPVTSVLFLIGKSF
jgi:hypothetical protein